jgi:hypothetical protein
MPANARAVQSQADIQQPMIFSLDGTLGLAQEGARFLIGKFSARADSSFSCALQ